MRSLFPHSFQIIVVLVLATILTGGISTAADTFDHWGSPYLLRRRRRKLLLKKSTSVSRENSSSPDVFQYHAGSDVNLHGFGRKLA